MPERSLPRGGAHDSTGRILLLTAFCPDVAVPPKREMASYRLFEFTGRLSTLPRRGGYRHVEIGRLA